MRGISIFQKPSYREIRPMRGRLMRGLPVTSSLSYPMAIFSANEIQTFLFRYTSMYLFLD